MSCDIKIQDYAPNYYGELLEATEIYRVEDAELCNLYTNIDDIQKQFVVSTATWGLREWERICGLPNGDSMNIVERRARILTKLRGTDTATRATMLSIMKAYTNNDDNDLIEYPREYRVEYIPSITGPVDLIGMYEQLRIYTPAHLDMTIGSSSTANISIAVVRTAGATLTLYPWFLPEINNVAEASHASATNYGAVVRILPKEV